MKKLLTLAILSLLGTTAWGQGTQHDRTTMRGVVVNHAATPTVSEIAGLVIPGNVGGTATAPSTGPGLAQEATTGGSIADGTYYCVWTGVNLNGETTPSPETSLVISAGTGTATIHGNAAGRSWWTGYFAFNLYCGTASGGPYYRVTPWSRTFTVDNNTVSRDANDFVTLTLTGTASMGVADGDTVVVSGATGCTDNPNGTFTIYSHVAGTANSSITFKHAGATESGCGGAAISVAFPTAIGLSAQADAHYIHSRLIFTSVPGSGTQPPSTNTAAIDDLQVALNAACSFSDNRCLKSVQLSSGNDGTGGTINQYFLSTPLILPGKAKLYGHSSNALGDTQNGARLFCGDTSAFSLSPGSNGGNVLWPVDGEKVGCVMAVTDHTGIRMEGISILSVSHSVFLLHGAGGSQSSNQNRFSTGTWSTSGTLCVAPLRIKGVFYYQSYDNIEFIAGSTTDCYASAGKPRGAAVMLSNTAGSPHHFTGQTRWTVPAKHDFIQHRGGPTDPDRGENQVGFNAAATIILDSIGHFQATAGGGTGVACRCQHTNLVMHEFSGLADYSVSASTDAAWILGHDSDSQSSGAKLFNANLTASTNNAATVKFMGTAPGQFIMFGGSLGSAASTIVFDMNSLSVPMSFFGTTVGGDSVCEPRTTATFTNRVTAPGSGSNAIQCFGARTSNTADNREGPHAYIQGGLVLQGFRATASDARIWGAWTENGTAFNWYRIDPDTASQKFMSWDTNTVDFFSSDGTTSLFQVDRTNTRSEFGGHVIFPTDNTFDFGALGATRPRTGYFGTSVVSPVVTASTSLSIGGGTSVTSVLSATASLDFTALAANTCEVLTITVTGAADGDVVQLGVPTALADVDGATERTVFFGWVSGANTVSVRRCNVTGTVTAEPAAATVRATVTKH